jgi:hypothetical protein
MPIEKVSLYETFIRVCIFKEILSKEWNILLMIEYVENDQQNVLNYILTFISLDDSYMFRQ